MIVSTCLSACASTESGGTGWVYDPDLGMYYGRDIAGAHPDLGSDGASGHPDLVFITNRSAGDLCGSDAECASNLCKPVMFDKSKACVIACTTQLPCQSFTNLFCEPQFVGAKTGYCIPRSAGHCAACATDLDCGSLSERCTIAPGDLALACHVDCSLAGADACPSDYTCSAIADGNISRMLCVPITPVCNDALGGYCDRIGMPQPCARDSAAGHCMGQRTCIMDTRRFDKCSAAVPKLKLTCAEIDPAGCVNLRVPAATTGPDNCGACGNVCPGFGQTTGDALCTSPSMKKCDFTCKGEHYDVNNDPTDGCEALHENPPGHTLQTASSRGNKDCNDTNSADAFSAHIDSDARMHKNPPVDSFDGTVGSAPDVWTVFATGGAFCTDDYAITITTTGGGNTVCYKLTFTTTKKTDSMMVNGKGTASISGGTGSYADGTPLYFTIEKTCTLPVQESVKYAVSYHL